MQPEVCCRRHCHSIKKDSAACSSSAAGRKPLTTLPAWNCRQQCSFAARLSSCTTASHACCTSHHHAAAVLSDASSKQVCQWLSCPWTFCALLVVHWDNMQVVLLEDIVQRRQLLGVLMAYNPFWLRLAAEVVTQRAVPQQQQQHQPSSGK